MQRYVGVPLRAVGGRIGNVFPHISGRSAWHVVLDCLNLLTLNCSMLAQIL